MRWLTVRPNHEEMTMFKSENFRRPQVWGLLLILLSLGAACPSAYSQSSVADELALAINQYAELEYDQSLASAKQLLDRPDLTPTDQSAIYSVLSMVHYAMGKDHHTDCPTSVLDHDWRVDESRSQCERDESGR